MRRETIVPRPGWRQRLEAVGFTFHSMDGGYWDESACYAFTAEEIDALESATAALHGLCLAAVEQIVAHRRFAPFAIPDAFHERIVASWRAGEPEVYGRFDLCCDGRNPPRLLEYNADTPTALLEASVAQWFWLQDQKPGMDQFNSLHERLIDRWRRLRGARRLPLHLHFACAGGSDEDQGTVDYLRDTALQAGFSAYPVLVEDIGWDTAQERFVDLEGRPIGALFKLYPWEWLVREEFAGYLLQDTMQVVEPYWKMLLSNKAILAVLWELFPGHPNLLPAFFTAAPLGESYVRKPLYSREGANVTLVTPQRTVAAGGPYGGEGWVYQQAAPLPVFAGRHVVIGSWVIGGEPAGIGLREDATPITRNTSRFVPHYFVP